MEHEPPPFPTDPSFQKALAEWREYTARTPSHLEQLLMLDKLRQEIKTGLRPANTVQPETEGANAPLALAPLFGPFHGAALGRSTNLEAPASYKPFHNLKKRGALAPHIKTQPQKLLDL